jgi:hypothetical protein
MISQKYFIGYFSFKRQKTLESVHEYRLFKAEAACKDPNRHSAASEESLLSCLHSVILSEAKNLIFYQFLKDEILRPTASG